MTVPRTLLSATMLLLTITLVAIRSGDMQTPASPARPALRFSTYLGGSGAEAGIALATDTDSNLYIAGITTSPDFPVLNPAFGYQGGTFAGTDIFIVKLSPEGALRYATYLGGSDDELVADLAVDAMGRVYVVGMTASDDFPTRSALYSYQGGALYRADGFLARLSADGSTLEFATYLGGSGDDLLTSLALDEAGRVYVAGTTSSGDLPTTPGAFQRAFGGGLALRSDAFAARVRMDGNALALDYTTYLGGGFDETAAALTVDAAGRAYLTGFTNSDDFPTRNPTQPDFAGPLRDLEGDAYLAILSPDGQSLAFSTYLGGRRDDQSTGLALDEAGSVYVTGWTRSPDFPVTATAMQPRRQGLQDVFLVRLPATGTATWRPDYATYLGGSGLDVPTHLAVDAEGRILVGGTTDAPDFPTQNALLGTYGGGASDAFVTRLNTDGTRLDFSTYLGGSGADALTTFAFGADGILCAIGSTGSPDFLQQNPLQAVFERPSIAGTVDQSAMVTCFTDTDTGVSVEAQTDVPASFALHPNYPNPFNPTTTISFDVKTQGRVVVEVYDVQGRRLATLVDGVHAPGRYTTQVDARAWASGVYFYRMRTEHFVKTRKMVFIK